MYTDKQIFEASTKSGLYLYQIDQLQKCLAEFPQNKNSPISLTPEIFKKAKIYPNITGNAFWDEDENLIIGTDGERYWYGYFVMEDNPYVHELIELKYVHDLQDLWRLKTGKDLEIEF